MEVELQGIGYNVRVINFLSPRAKKFMIIKI